MQNGSALFAAWSYGLAAFAYAAFAVALAVSKRQVRSGANDRALMFAVGFAAIWGALGLAFALTSSHFLFIAEQVVDVVRYGAWYAFMLSLLEGATPGAGKAVTARLSLRLIGGSLVAAGLVVQATFILGGISQVAWSSATWMHALGMSVFALLLLEQLVRNLSSDSIWHVKPLAVGLAGFFLFDIYLSSDAVLFKTLDADVFSARGFVHALVAPLLWTSVTRTKDWVAKIRLSQKAAFHSATFILAGGYLLFMAAVGYYVRSFGGDWNRALAVAVIFALLLGLGVLIFSASTRARLRVLVGKHFFSYRYDYREEWLRFTHTLSNQNTPESMGQQVIRGLANLVESPAGSLWIKDPATREFTQMARWNMPASDARESSESPMCRFIERSGWVINMEEYRSFPGRYASLALPEWVAQFPNAWLIVPLMAGESLIGFSMLASARTDLDVNWEVNDLLRTAGRQAASFLTQMQATEALLEARKFDSFNRMSAFVVHDLKNIVTQLALLLKNAERHGDNPEFQADMRMTVHHSVERMRQLMLQLREGATPPGTPVGVDLAAIIERIGAAKAPHGRGVEVTIGERAMTRGHEERIERVVGHLVQNALDATEAMASRGRVQVKLERRSGQAVVEVRDNGIGMTPEFIREHLFRPFQTTKKAGMGIGAYESFQYTQEIGGKLDVRSEVGVGTTISLHLPLFELDQQSDLLDLPGKVAA